MDLKSGGTPGSDGNRRLWQRVTCRVYSSASRQCHVLQGCDNYVNK